MNNYKLLIIMEEELKKSFNINLEQNFAIEYYKNLSQIFGELSSKDLKPILFETYELISENKLNPNIVNQRILELCKAIKYKELYKKFISLFYESIDIVIKDDYLFKGDYPNMDLSIYIETSGNDVFNNLSKVELIKKRLVSLGICEVCKDSIVNTEIVLREMYSEYFEEAGIYILNIPICILIGEIIFPTKGAQGFERMFPVIQKIYEVVLDKKIDISNPYDLIQKLYQVEYEMTRKLNNSFSEMTMTLLKDVLLNGYVDIPCTSAPDLSSIFRF